MIDLHSHILPGLDDGAPNMAASLQMARAYVEDGVIAVACTPHILPGVYRNTGPAIRAAVAALQDALDREHIALQLFSGADNHIVPDLVEGLNEGRLLALAQSRYVLVEPPHNVAPPRLEEFLHGVLLSGYVPIVTHPERLSWIRSHFEMMVRLSRAGVWMQITAGSLAGSFGRDAQYWAERMLGEGIVHILASDAHNMTRRRPDLKRGRHLAAKKVGEAEAGHLVQTRPMGVLQNVEPSVLPSPQGATEMEQEGHNDNDPVDRQFLGRLRRLFN